LSDFQTGLVISGIGLSVTFLALLIFIGVMVLLQKLFPVKKEKTEEQPVEDVNLVEISVNSDGDMEEIIAALAAVAFIHAQRAGQLGASLLSGPGPYRTSR
jgi:Na+-transporting methylmalonyl-CoA/oxaloacetate decarboxylase gamma subunit